MKSVDDHTRLVGKGLGKWPWHFLKVLLRYLSGMAGVTTNTSVRRGLVQSEIRTE
jgi:hypothetical protein